MEEEKAKRCYYEILGLDQRATSEEIRLAYRKKALEHHPDRNHGNEEAAAAAFKEVQEAYVTLNDPQERAWYDAHRDAILRGESDGTCAPDELNLFPFFSAHCFTGFGDDPNGFFAVFGKVFSTISTEDSAYAEAPVPPSFGGCSAPYPEVAKFYSAWHSYSTRKTFAWKDEYKPSDMPERQMRRAAERANFKVRDAARREYSKLVQELVRWVHRRDPRVEAEKRRQSEEDKQKEEARMAALRDQEARKRRNDELLWEELFAVEERRAAEERAEAERVGGTDVLEMVYTKAAIAKEEKDRQQSLLEKDEETKVPQEWKCDICKIRCKSLHLYEEHMRSSKHKTKMRKCGVQQPAGEAPAEEGAGPAEEAGAHLPSALKKPDPSAPPAMSEPPQAQPTMKPRSSKKGRKKDSKLHGPAGDDTTNEQHAEEEEEEDAGETHIAEANVFALLKRKK